MKFSFIDDPKWQTLDRDTQQKVIALAFQENIASDPSWSNLDGGRKKQVADLYFKEAEEYSISKEPKPGILATVGKGLAHGSLGLAESVGTGVEYLGNRVGSEGIAEAGRVAKNYWGEKADRFAPSKNIYGKNVWDNPEILKNAEFWLYNISDMVPTLAASIVPGAATARGLQLAGAIPKLARLGGAAVGGLTGGAIEGTQTYSAVLERGGTEEEAARAAELMTAGASVLNALSVGKVLSKAGNTFKGKVLKHMGAGAWEGITEGLEEPTEVFSKYFGAYLAGEKLPDNLKAQLVDSAKEALTVAPIAAVIGVGGSIAAGPSDSNDTQTVTPEMNIDDGPDQEPGPSIAGAKDVDEAVNAFEATINQDLEAYWQGQEREILNQRGMEQFKRGMVSQEGMPQADRSGNPTYSDANPFNYGPGERPRAAEQEQFINDLIRQAGSYEAVEDLYPADDPDAPYVLAKARRVYAPKEQTGGIQAETEPPETYASDIPQDQQTRLVNQAQIDQQAEIDRINAELEENGDDPFLRPGSGAPTQEKDAEMPGQPVRADEKRGARTEGVEFVHDHTNTQVNIGGVEASKIRNFASRIPDSELYTEEKNDSYGRENEPHITVKYGLKTNDPSDVKKIVSNHPPIKAKMGKVSIFENGKYDVVKVEIDSPDLHALNKKIEDEAEISLPKNETFDYSPHATIAYVKPGEGRKYIGDKFFEGGEATFDEITVSTRDGRQHQIKLNGKPIHNAPSAPESSAPQGVTFSPGQPVTWQTKKGETLSGTLVKQGKKTWTVEKPDGKKTWVHTKDLKIADPAGPEAATQVPKQKPMAAQTQEDKIAAINKFFGSDNKTAIKKKLIELKQGREQYKDDPEFVKQIDDKITELEDRIREKPVNHPAFKEAVEASTNDILTKSGTPFKSKGAAVLAIIRDKAKETHDPVEVDGGWVGREREIPVIEESDYDRKQAERAERFRERAAGARDESNRQYQRSGDAVSGIPFGQPILVGHHSEGKHRAALRRSDTAMRKSIEADKKADHYERRAASAESNNAISSDDSNAIVKLKEKLRAAEQEQEAMKAINKIVRKKKLSDQEKVDQIVSATGWPEKLAKKILEPDFAGRVGFPSYRLQNNNANIRRMKERVAHLERQAQDETKEIEFDGGKIVDNVEDNRVQIFHDEKPSEEVREKLKRGGFRWARSVGAWQRKRSKQAMWAAQNIAGIAPQYSTTEDAPGLYSVLEKGIENIQQETAPAFQWLGMIKKIPGLKQEEMEWTGIREWLAEQKGKVTKQDILDFVRANNVEVTEVERGGDTARKLSEAARKAYRKREAEYIEYVRDLSRYDGPRKKDGTPNLNHVRAWQKRVEKDMFPDLENLRESMSKTYDDAAVTKFSGYQLPGGENYKELLLTLPTTNDRYQSSHFDEPNILAHVRFNERTDAEGNRVLFIEEIQSDWHQEGRKKGYNGESFEAIRDLSKWETTKIPEGAAYTERYVNTEKIGVEIRVDFFGEKYLTVIDGAGYGGYDSIESAANAIADMLEQGKGVAVPNAPFKKSWPLLAFKRMVRYAAENGFDKVAWTTGEQQAARYDLSKQISHIDHRKTDDGYHIAAFDNDMNTVVDKTGLSEDQLENHVGKDVAKRIINGEGSQTKGYGGFKRLQGDGLKVGGEGMAVFYDKMLPSMVNKAFKKFGAKTKVLDMPDTGQQLSIDITPKLKAAAMGEGLPMFQAQESKAKPAKLTLQDIAARFPNQEVSIDGNTINIRFKNGKGLKITQVEQISDDDYRFAVETGRMTKNGRLLGKATAREIELDEGYATAFTRDHELIHALEFSGILNRFDLNIIDAKARQYHKAGKFAAKWSDDPMENRANIMAQLLSERETHRKTALGRIIQKVTDFLDGLWYIGRTSARKVARGIESGNIYTRDAKNQSAERAYSTTEDVDNSPTFGKDESTLYQKGMDILSAVLDKSKPTSDKKDVSAAAHLLKSTMYNAEKIGGAYKRVWDVVRQRDTWKMEKQHELWHETNEKGEEVSLLEDFKRFMKPKAVFKEVSNYLLKRDVMARGFIVKKADDGFDLLHWKKTNGKRNLIHNYETEEDAWNAAIYIEAGESNLSEMGQEALIRFRKMAHNLYHHFAAEAEQLAAAYEKAGKPAPEVTIQTKDGYTKVDLKAAAALMGDRRGYYFPRLRKSGQYMVEMAKEGEATQLQFFDSKLRAKAYTAKWKRQGYEVQKFDKVGKLSEDLFQNLSSLVDQESIMNQALKRIAAPGRHRNLEDINLKGEWRGKDFVVFGRGLGGIEEEMLVELGGEYQDHLERLSRGESYRPEVVFKDVEASRIEDLENRITNSLLRANAMFPDMDLAFSGALAKEYDTILKARGARARMIGRSDATGLNVKQGYETDPIVAIAQSMQAAAGSYAKARVAKEGVAALSGRDISWQDYKSKSDKSETIQSLEAELKDLDLATPEQQEQKARLKEELSKTRQRLENTEFLKVDDAIKEQQRIKSILKEIKGLTRWSDIDAAKSIQARINEAKTGVYEDYLKEIKRRRVDAAKQPRAYKEASAVLKDILRNEEVADRVIGTLKGLAVWQYLGFRVSSAAINMTNLVTGVPATINGETENKVSINSALRHVGVALKDYGLHRAGKLTGEKKWVFDEIKQNGWDAPVFNREAFDVLSTRLGRVWSRALEASMWVFGKTEEMNRASTIAGAYFAMKKANKGKWDKAAMLEKAKDISDHGHGVYGKENRPYHMRGDNIGARTLQTTYVFSTFIHNYLQEMYRLGWDKKQGKAALYMALSPAMFGVGSTVPMGLAKAIASAFGQDDPEEEMIRVAEELFGAGDFARFGITSIGGHGVSLKGSLATRFGPPDTFLSIFGAPGSVLADVWEGGKNITKGYYREGFEKMAPAAFANISKGLRESGEGVTTRSGNPVYFGKEQLKGDTLDMILRFLSFNPTGIAKAKEIQWNEYKVIDRYKRHKADLYKRMRKLYMDPPEERDRAGFVELYADMRDFNTEVRDKGIQRLVSPINRLSIRAALRRFGKPSKQERMRKE